MNSLKPLLISLVCSLCCGQTLIAQQPVVFTYGGGYRGNVINVEAVEAKKLTHILYAFADVYKNKAHLNYPKTDDLNLRNLSRLRKIKPQLKLLISVGGLGWSRNFSTMAMNAETRKLFAVSCRQLVLKYALDGVDIDWEFPGYKGEGGNIYRPEDKTNYTLLFQALRKEFDSLEARTGKAYLITTAVDGWGSHFIPHTEMDLVQKYTDYILVMAYNFNTPQLVGGHFLYAPDNWPAEGSLAGAMEAFRNAGVPGRKLVAGIGFFPSAFRMAGPDPYDRRYLSRPPFRGGLARVSKMINMGGYLRYWDDAGKSPYLFNPLTRLRISYEDERSVTAKAVFVKAQKLAGVMYWDYFSDPRRRLLTAISDVFSIRGLEPTPGMQ
jgi:chitinase